MFKNKKESYFFGIEIFMYIYYIMINNLKQYLHYKQFLLYNILECGMCNAKDGELKYSWYV